CVNASTLYSIYYANTAGKCHESCYISHDTPYYNGGATSYLVINNSAAVTQHYHWSLAPCSANGLSFSPNSGTAQVLPHGSTSILLPAVLPPPSYGQSFCFVSTVVNDSTGECFQCTGAVTRPRWWGPNWPFVGLPLATSHDFVHWLYN